MSLTNKEWVSRGNNNWDRLLNSLQWYLDITASNLQMRNVTHLDGIFSGQSLCFLRPLFRELLSVQPYTLMIAQIMSLKLLIFPMIQTFSNHEIKTYLHWKLGTKG